MDGLDNLEWDQIGYGCNLRVKVGCEGGGYWAPRWASGPHNAMVCKWTLAQECISDPYL